MKHDYGQGPVRHEKLRNKPSDMGGSGYSDASYRPGYDLGKSLKEASEDDLKRGFQKGG